MKKNCQCLTKHLTFYQKLLETMKTYCIVWKKDTENKNPKVF